MPKLSLPTLLVLATSACGIFGPDMRFFDEDRTYAFDFFETHEDCLAAQPPDFFFNCSQTIDFFVDGDVEMMVTDIINPGTYEIRGRRVTLKFGFTPELPSTIDFELSRDEQILTEVKTGKEWVRR